MPADIPPLAAPTIVPSSVTGNDCNGRTGPVNGWIVPLCRMPGSPLAFEEAFQLVTRAHINEQLYRDRRTVRATRRIAFRLHCCTPIAGSLSHLCRAEDLHSEVVLVTT